MTAARGRPGGRPARGRPWLFAVEDRAIQVTWTDDAPAPVRARVDGRAVDLGLCPDRVAGSGPGAGSISVTGLTPARAVAVELDLAGGGTWSHTAQTLAAPPGPELFRFATLSDLHLGEGRFGYRGRIIERPVPVDLHPVRCARAAIADLGAWGAALLVVKGDITHRGRPAEWDQFRDLLADTDLPHVLVPGNHDHGDGAHEPLLRRGAGPLPMAQAFARLGTAPPDKVQVRDVPGLRIVAVDTSVPGHRPGRIHDVAEHVASLAAEASGPAMIVLHHQLTRERLPWYLPRGIPPGEARAFLDLVTRANPAVLVTSGHTHRHRRWAHRGAVITEVGSPKDYPGTWAGYVVHEGGIRQVVRRVAAPDVLAWTDRTADAAGGLWGRWSPGRLDDRCFTHVWPGRAASRRN